MSASLDGSGTSAPLERVKRSAFGVGSPATSGVHRGAGASVGSSSTLRGPVRRSSSAAIDVRQLCAAIARCAGVIVTCTSFSASANVAGVTPSPPSAPPPPPRPPPPPGGGGGVVGGGGGAARGVGGPAPFFVVAVCV